MRIPNFKDPEVTKFMIEYMRDQEREARGKMDSNTANRAVLLYSPSKKVYEIKVDDAGVISATKVAG
jgi:hypothetical protein